MVDTKPLDKFFRDVHRLNKRLQWAKNNVLFKQVHQKRFQNFTWSFKSKPENHLTSLACCRPLYWASKHSINRRKVMWLSAHESLNCLQCYHSTFGIVFFKANRRIASTIVSNQLPFSCQSSPSGIQTWNWKPPWQGKSSGL